MMGLNYGCPIDMWAAGVSLFELYTGKIMFQGNSNNHMLKLIQEVKGKMPHKLISKGTFSELHFDPDYDFLSKERDKVRPATRGVCVLAAPDVCGCVLPLARCDAGDAAGDHTHHQI